jgi:hypothetical protein
MKIKNMKLMLLGLLAMGASNASATVGDMIKRANLVYKVTADATTTPVANAKVQFVGMVSTPEASDADGAIANQPDGTITIPSTTWTMNTEGNKTNYDVTSIDPLWYTARTVNGVATKDVSATLKKLVSQVVEYDTDGKSVISNLKAINFTDLEEVTLPTGQTVLTKDAFYGCTKLATINLGNITDFGQACLHSTAITTLDLSKATKIGVAAFAYVKNVTTVTIPATVTSIGAQAFQGMYQDEVGTPGTEGYIPEGGLAELTFNAYSDKDKGFATIPAIFAGDKFLKKLTITSTKATAFEANAFADAVKLEELDLSGCTELATIAAGDFGASTAFTTIKLAGTKIKAIDKLNISKSNQTLATITLPTTLESLEAQKFMNFVALTALDLSGTQVKTIPTSLCEYEATEHSNVQAKNADGSWKYEADGTTPVYIAPALASVALNAETSSIGIWAFAKQASLATVTGLNQDKLKAIGQHAFDGTGLTTLDLSAATNADFKTIDNGAFANMASLATVTLPTQITTIVGGNPSTDTYGAFAYDKSLTSINLSDLEKLTTLENIFNYGVVGVDAKAREVVIPIATLTLPDALTEIKNGALQLLNIEEITIPATVTSLGDYALQGCINLKKFVWEDTEANKIYGNTFLGDDKLEEVRFMSKKATTTLGSTDNDDIFKGNDKDVLKVYVNAESYVDLRGKGWSEANLKYCTLVGEGESELDLTAKSGEYYYKTYRSKDNATWFKAEDVEVFTAVVEGSKVVLKAASTEGGYYKVAKYATPTIIDDNGEQQKNAVCIIRSTNKKVTCELKSADFNDLSTLSDDNALQVAKKDFSPSRLKYQYKFGTKDGKLAFWRVTSGTIKKDGIFIDSAVKKDRLDIVFEGDATAIQAFKAEVENNAPIYNLNGVRVNKAQKGVYIQNGKKYMMK